MISQKLDKNGLPHCVDGPAIIRNDGTEEWWFHGDHHRMDGPAIIYPNGTQEWMVKGKRHRVDGPAILCADGEECWYYHGKRHRENGPAIIYPDGTTQWFLLDYFITKWSMYKQLSGCSDEQLAWLILKYGDICDNK